MRFAPLLMLAALGVAADARAARLTPADSLERAATLHRWAEQRLLDPSVESRQRVLRDLREATALDPRNASHWLLLGRALSIGRFRAESRQALTRATELAPGDPEAFLELAHAWKREWLEGLDRPSLDHAVEAFERVVELRPHAGDAWLHLVALRYERGDLAGAGVAAERALEERPRRGLSWLAVAYTAYRRGDIERAHAAYAKAIPWLEAEARPLFEDLSPLVSAEQSAWVAAAAPQERAQRIEAVWQRIDFDPTTPENETRLEFWSRAAHVYLMFLDPLRTTLDARALTFLRYGPPQRVERNPLGTPLFTTHENPGRAAALPRARGSASPRTAMEFPLNAQVWSYPEYGMRLVLQDRGLTGRYETGLLRDDDPSQRPSERLAGRGDLLVLGGGQAIFPTLPPRDQRLEMTGLTARFQGERGPRVMAQVQAAGGPGDSLVARWVVQDAQGRELARDSQPLTTSACDPTTRRTATFTADVPPGAVQVAVSVRGPHHRRGLYRATTEAAPVEARLALSDLVLSCGDPSLAAGEGVVRLDADVERRVSGAGPLVVYFEAYHLAAGADGVSRFEYECRVEPADERGAPKFRLLPWWVPVQVRREAEQLGSTRRQFVSVPTGSLAPGRHRIEMRVWDRLARVEARGWTTFVKE